ncbi:MAG TPA: FtsX-like permease family protein, partial [Thermoanaerobaculia bacterium]|nr:FtsX-like permease family protein [Thermoanaerobaculia bacterium]
ERVAVVRLDLPPQALEGARAETVYDEMLREAHAIPGVSRAALASDVPLSGSRSRTTFAVEDALANRQERRPEADLYRVTPGYFETLGLRVVAGRTFDQRDRADTRSVAVIDETFARRYWPGESPVGRRLWRDTPEGLLEAEIVGIVSGARGRLHERPSATLYWPLAKSPTTAVRLVARTEGDPQALLPSLSRGLAAEEALVTEATTLERQMLDWLEARRFLVRLLFGFSLAATALAVLGVYGVTTYAVGRRTHEIGIRLALGAKRADVLGLFLKDASRLTAIGLAVGLVVTLGSTRFIGSLLAGLSPLDPPILLGSCLGLVLVSLAATLLAARRATKVQPGVSLRTL